MKHVLATAICTCALLSSAPALAQIADGSFETQAPAEIGANPGYCYYNNGGAGPQCTGVQSPWETFNGGGFQLESNLAWPGEDTPAGEYYAFIQNEGSVNQQFTASASGSFVIDFLAAGRDGSVQPGNALFEVLLGGNVIFSGGTTTGQPWTLLTTNPFDLIMGQTYSLSFHGISNGPDNTAFIDNAVLRAAAVPEPSTWAMLLLGFGAAGLAMRRHRGRDPAPQLA